jgi:hypothetical protein
VTLRARLLTLRARWVTLRARGVTFQVAEAAARGIPASRLVFSDPAPPESHLKRCVAACTHTDRLRPQPSSPRMRTQYSSSV